MVLDNFFIAFFGDPSNDIRMPEGLFIYSTNYSKVPTSRWILNFHLFLKRVSFDRCRQPPLSFSLLLCKWRLTFAIVLSGVFVTEVPGIHPLAAQLNVNHKTVTKALRLLEVEGVLASQGPGRRRRIINSKSTEDQSLRVGILCLEASDPGLDPLIDTAEGGTIGRVPKSSV